MDPGSAQKALCLLLVRDDSLGFGVMPLFRDHLDLLDHRAGGKIKNPNFIRPVSGKIDMHGQVAWATRHGANLGASRQGQWNIFALCISG